MERRRLMGSLVRMTASMSRWGCLTRGSRAMRWKFVRTGNNSWTSAGGSPVRSRLQGLCVSAQWWSVMRLAAITGSYLRSVRSHERPIAREIKSEVQPCSTLSWPGFLCVDRMEVHAWHMEVARFFSCRCWCKQSSENFGLAVWALERFFTTEFSDRRVGMIPRGEVV